MKELHFVIPVPLSINRTYKVASRRGGQAFMYLSTDAKEFKSIVYLIAKTTADNDEFQVIKTDKLGLELRIFPPSLRADTDGGLKLTKDAIAEGIGFNDRQIWEDHLYRVEVDKINPRCEIRVWIR